MAVADEGKMREWMPHSWMPAGKVELTRGNA